MTAGQFLDVYQRRAETMNTSIRTVNRRTVVALSGRVVIETVGDIRRRLHELVDGDSRELIINLSEVDFMDSTGLSVLISTNERALAKGGKVSLSALPREIRALIELTRLHEIFEIYEDDLAAAASCAFAE
jgi:anti-sigma B factor antagonist